MHDDPFRYGHVVKNCSHIRLRIVPYLLVELKGGLVIAETEVAKGQAVHA